MVHIIISFPIHSSLTEDGYFFSYKQRYGDFVPLLPLREVIASPFPSLQWLSDDNRSSMKAIRSSDTLKTGVKETKIAFFKGKYSTSSGYISLQNEFLPFRAGAEKTSCHQRGPSCVKVEKQLEVIPSHSSVIHRCVSGGCRTAMRSENYKKGPPESAAVSKCLRLLLWTKQLLSPMVSTTLLQDPLVANVFSHLHGAEVGAFHVCTRLY